MNTATQAARLLLPLLLGCQPLPPTAPPPLGQPSPNGSMVTEGVISSVERPRPEDAQTFVHVVMIPADKQPIRLVLAPGWYLDEHGIRFDPQQSLRVEGRRTVENGTPTIVVRSLQQGERSYILRDEQEQPAWLKP